MERIMAGSEDKGQPPCIVYCREIWIEDEIVALANKYHVPLLRSRKATSPFMAELIRWFMQSLHRDVRFMEFWLIYMVKGVLIMGESGIGKSEVALELIHRGHRLSAR